MSAVNSLQYLSTVDSMEMKAYTPNKDKLLEMDGGSSRRTCWRAPGSHDLVIKDLLGDSKFCVGGTEIKNHPISVYYREGQTIGTIRSNKLKLTGEDSAEDISTSVHIFTVAGNRIETFPTHITISFNPRAAVELKAMVIAFAIQQALAYDFLQKSLPVGLVSPQSISNSSIVPKQNKQNIPVFNDENNQTYYIRMAGPSSCTQYLYILFWMDSSDRHNVLLTAVTDIQQMQVKNVIGELEYTVKMERDSPISNVFVNSEQIGILDVRRGNKGKKVLTTTKSSSESKMFVEWSPEKGDVVDSAGIKLATFKKSGEISLEITFIQMTPDQKKVVSAFAILTMYRVVKYARESPQLMVTTLSCNCPFCQRASKPSRRIDKFDIINTLYVTSNLGVAVAGHNSAKNFVYLNVFDRNSKKICLTLQCTPIEKFQGLAQLAAKDEYGRTIFQAVALPDDVLAIYSHKNKLIGYQCNGQIFDEQDNLIMEVKKLTDQLKLTGKQDNYEYKMFDSRTKRLISNLQYHYFFVGVYLPGPLGDPKLLEIAMAITFGTKLFFSKYTDDLCTSPEISYRYKGSTKDASRLCVVYP